MTAPGRTPRNLIRRPAPAPDSFPARLTEDGTGNGGLYGFVELEYASGSGGWRDKLEGRTGTYSGPSPAISATGNEALTAGQRVMLTERVAFDETISYLISTDGAAVVYEADDEWIEIDGGDNINHIGPSAAINPLESVTALTLEMEDHTGSTPPYYEVPTLTIESEVHDIDAKGHVILGSEGDRATVTLDLVDALNDCITGDDDISVDVVGSGTGIDARKQLQISLTTSGDGGCERYMFWMDVEEGSSGIVTLDDDDWRGHGLIFSHSTYASSSADVTPAQVSGGSVSGSHNTGANANWIPNTLASGTSFSVHTAWSNVNVKVFVDFADGGKLKAEIYAFQNYRAQVIINITRSKAPLSEPTHVLTNI